MFNRSGSSRPTTGPYFSKALGAYVESDWRRSLTRRAADQLTGRYQRPPVRSTRRVRLFMAGVVLGILGTVLWTQARAETHVIAHGVSVHGKSVRDFDGQPYNERNAGLGLRHVFEPAWAVQAGAFRNSYDRTSAYLIGEYLPVGGASLRAGVFAGLTHNYPANDFGVVPAAGVVVRAQIRSLSIALRGVPPSNKTSGTLALEAGWRL